MKTGWQYIEENGVCEKIAPNTLIANVFQSESGPSLMNVLLDFTHPVGSIWMSAEDTDPNLVFGGTWIRVKDTFLLAAGDEYLLGETGGEAKHTLSESELPAINRNMIFRRFYNTSTGSYYSVHIETGSNTSNQVIEQNVSSPKFTGAQNEQTAERVDIDFGNNEAHNNMPPYLVVNVWKRTS